MKYQDRVVTYIDILGFKRLIEDTIDDEGNEITEKVEVILDAYKKIREAWGLDGESMLDALGHEAYRSQGKVITLFSDLVVVSFLQAAESGIWQTLNEISMLILELANVGIFCRGMVTFGKLYHTESAVFGPALVEAYIGETKAALYPRVILSPEIIEIAKTAKAKFNSEEEEEEYIKRLIKLDNDGMFYIDYFDSTSFDDPSYDYVAYLSILRRRIHEGLKSRRPDVRIKFMWLKERYNEAAKSVQGNAEYFEKTNDLEMAELCSQVELL